MKRWVWMLIVVALAAGDVRGAQAGTPRAPQAVTIWMQVTPPTLPSPRWGAAMAYDVARDRVVLFGGASSRTPTIYYYDETWEFNGTTWARPDVQPPADVIFARMVWHNDHGRVLLFGGESWVTPAGQAFPPGTACGLQAGLQENGAPDYYLQNKMWEWNGTVWALVTQNPAPAESFGRCGHGLVYDTDLQALVLHGGRNYDGYISNTSEWHEPGWIDYTASGPLAREDFAMVYNTARNQTLLFGGLNGSTYLGDTWEWGGVFPARSWSAQTPSAAPAARRGPSAAYDSVGARVVLFGGRGASGVLGDTWAWNGDWAPAGIQGTPGGRYDASMVYDSLRQRFVLFGGATESGDLGDMWVTAVYTPTAYVYLPAMTR